MTISFLTWQNIIKWCIKERLNKTTHLSPHIRSIKFIKATGEAAWYILPGVLAVIVHFPIDKLHWGSCCTRKSRWGIRDTWACHMGCRRRRRTAALCVIQEVCKFLGSATITVDRFQVFSILHIKIKIFPQSIKI